MMQYKILLSTCPEEISFGNRFGELPLLTLPADQDFDLFKNNVLWNKAHSLCEKVISSVQKMYTVLEKCKKDIPSIEYNLKRPSYILINDINNLMTNLHSMLLTTTEIRDIFGDIPLSEPLTCLMNEAKTLLQGFDSISTVQKQSNAQELLQCQKSLEDLTKNVLLIMQHLYTKYDTKTMEDTESLEGDDCVLTENHLEGMIKQMNEDVATLQMERILKAADELAFSLFALDPRENSEVQDAVSQSVPLLEQLLLLYQYFITQQVSAYRVICKMSSILFNIFIDLVSKVKQFVND